MKFRSTSTVNTNALASSVTPTAIPPCAKNAQVLARHPEQQREGHEGHLREGAYAGGRSRTHRCGEAFVQQAGKDHLDPSSSCDQRSLSQDDD